MVSNDPFESIAPVGDEVLPQMIEQIDTIRHLEHGPASIELLDRNRLEPFVVVGAEDLRSPADVVAMNAQRTVG